jgi:hypothetical protein
VVCVLGEATKGLITMDYFQGVVTEYLRANRSTFVNPEFCLQLHEGKTPPKGSFWYVDLLAVDLKERSAYLCEVTYSQGLSTLLQRLAAWSAHWSSLLLALRRDAHIGDDWPVRPWIFVPEALLAKLIARMPTMPVTPRITPLEMTEPWKYCGWDRRGEASKLEIIPATMM